MPPNLRVVEPPSDDLVASLGGFKGLPCKLEHFALFCFLEALLATALPFLLPCHFGGPQVVDQLKPPDDLT
jgi:hypothetical protein